MALAPDHDSFGRGLTYLESKPSSDDERPMIFRYLADKVVQVPRPDFVAEVDRFVRELLDSTEGKGSDLSVLWEDLSREREDRELSRFRKFEALLGADPDDLDSDDLISRQREISELGRTAAEEIALGSDGVDHLIDEQGRSVGSGIYLYRLIAGTHTRLGKMVLLR